LRSSHDSAKIALPVTAYLVGGREERLAAELAGGRKQVASMGRETL
jgi:hypothetical protein